ncbi:MAG: cytochrome c3 family protein [bacterium]
MIPSSLPAATDYSTNKVCLLCHPEEKLINSNGCKKWQKHGHPVDVVPSIRIHIPDQYPLDERGRMVCGTCHVPVIYQLDSDSEESGLPLRGQNDNSSMCRQCHFRQMSSPDTRVEESHGYEMLIEDVPLKKEKTELKGKSSFYSHPVGVRMSRFPKHILKAGGKMGARKDEVICETCHSVHRAKSDRLLIMNNSRGQLCGVCHAPMYGDNREQTSKKGTHPINIVPSSGVLSQMIAFKSIKRMGTDNQLLCSSCHLVHGAPVGKNLLVSTNKNDILCKNCHREIFENIVGTRHDIQESLPDLKSIRGMRAAEGGKCSPCHLVHRGTGAGMWALKFARKIPGDPIKMLCESCHYQGQAVEKAQVGKFTHPTSVPLSSADSNYTSLPGYSKQGNRTAGGLVTCATCHDVHRWSPVSKDKGKTARADSSNSFLRKSNYKSSLCFECHITPSYISNTSHDFTGDIYKNSSKPVPRIISKKPLPAAGERGTCDYCHGVHNAAGVKLWIRQLGPGKNKITQICSSCHSPGMIAGNKQVGRITHPVDVSILKLGSSASTDLPLFNEDLTKDPQGMVMCNSCHDVHRWNPKSGAVVNPPREGDLTNSFLRLSSSDSRNPLCVNCHKEASWVRGTSHDLSLSAPDSTNLQGRTPKQSGLCGSCHGVHNGLTRFMLWNYTIGDGDDLISKICNGCHSQGKIAQGKLTGRHSHPVGIPVFRVLDDLEETSLNIYDNRYKPLNSPENRRTQAVSVQRSIEKSKGREHYKETSELTERFRNLKGLYLDFREEMTRGREQIVAKLDKKERLRDQIAAAEKDIRLLGERTEKSARRIVTLSKKYSKVKKELERKERALKREEERENVNKAQQKYNNRKGGRGEAFRRGKKRAFITSTKRFDLKELRKQLLPVRKNEEKLRKGLTGLKEAQKDDHRKLKERETDLVSYKDEIKLAAEELLSLSRDYHTVKQKSLELKEMIVSLNPRAFRFARASAGDESLFLKPNNEPDYRKSYFNLLEKNTAAKNRWKRLVKRSRKVRNKFLKLIITPSEIDDISDFELDGILDEDLREEIQKDYSEKSQGKIFCSSCHDTHKWSPAGKPDKNGGFLKISNTEGYRLCRECHRDKSFVVGTDHDLRVTAADETNYQGKTAEESGVCGSCHSVHNAAESFALWSKESPFREKIQELEESRKRLKELRREIRFKSVERKELKNKLAPKRPGKTRRSLIRLKKKLLLLKVKQKKLHKDRNLSLSQKKIINRSYQSQITSLTRILKKRGVVLAPKKKKKRFEIERYNTLQVELKSLKKASEALALKIKSIERERKLAGGWNIYNGLCKSCHDDDKAAWTKTIGFKSHPINVKSRYFLETLGETGAAEQKDREAESGEPSSLTRELNKLVLLSSYPLYTQEGKRNFKSGRVFCPTCHNVHQWNPRKFEPGKGMDEEGNAWSSFLRLPNAPKPELCLNCHFQTGKVVGTKHDLSVTAPTAKNFRGKTVEQAGVCSACHVAHNSYDRYKLWSREFGPSFLPAWLEGYRIKDNRPVQVCTSCHREGGWAAERQPEAGLHYYSPLYYLKEAATILENPKFAYYKYEYRKKTVNMAVREILAGAAPKYPVYLPSGQVSPQGNIACATCHDPHIRSAKEEKKGGDGSAGKTSFLKSGIAENFCADCHREKALYKFSFYHKDRLRLRKNQGILPGNPHWKADSLKLTDCTASCHKEGLFQIHPSGTVVDRKKMGISAEVPLGKNNTIVCITCHDLNKQTALRAGERNRNRYFIRDWYMVSYKDAITVTPRVKTKGGDLIIGGPPTQMVDHLKDGSSNKGNLRETREKQLGRKTGWIKSSLFTQHNVCFNCHKKSDSPAFNPHVHQLLKNGRINKENCALCHYRIPNRRRHILKEKDYFLRAKLEFYCLGCHTGHKKNHPGGNTHFGLIMTDKLMKNLRKQRKEALLPLKQGKILCPSCHNTHQPGIIRSRARKWVRARNPNWLRFSGKDVCTVCHIKVSQYAPKIGASPF